MSPFLKVSVMRCGSVTSRGISMCKGLEGLLVQDCWGNLGFMLCLYRTECEGESRLEWQVEEVYLGSYGA